MERNTDNNSLFDAPDHDPENANSGGMSSNTILALVLSIAVLGGFQFFYEAPRQKRIAEEQAAIAATLPAATDTAKDTVAASDDGDYVGVSLPSDVAVPESSPLAEAAESLPDRVVLQNDNIKATISPKGLRLDDVILSKYFETVERKTPIHLLEPSTPIPTETAAQQEATAKPYFASLGWLSGDSAIALPTDETLWTLQNSTPTVAVFTYKTDTLEVERTIQLDSEYVFAISDKITNKTAKDLQLYPYAVISREGAAVTDKTVIGIPDESISRTGLIAYTGHELKQEKYKDMPKKGIIELPAVQGWLGFSDKYWLTALIPDKAAPVDGRFVYKAADGNHRLQVDYRGMAQTVAAGASLEYTQRIFTGAKEVKVLDNYEKTLSVPHLDMAVDFGMFYFMTKPFFYALKFLGEKIGNFGLGILCFTVLVRILVFPLANKSFREMNRMKDLQPKIQDLKERTGDDQTKFQQEMMELYKREGVNPVGGCLPMIIQMPIFFALYKVLYVTIEMRQAPFYGWIKDLSAADPTSVWNLFGLIPWDAPAFLPVLGVLPLMMGITMYLQQLLNPPPTDPTQKQVMMFLPLIFTFMMAHFSAGLVMYWTWSNILSVLQQWTIRKLSESNQKDSGKKSEPPSNPSKKSIKNHG